PLDAAGACRQRAWQRAVALLQKRQTGQPPLAVGANSPQPAFGPTADADVRGRPLGPPAPDSCLICGAVPGAVDGARVLARLPRALTRGRAATAPPAGQRLVERD